MNRDLKDMRINYVSDELDVSNVDPNPLNQFTHWLDEVLRSDEIEPNGMTLATVDENGHPSARTVLLKETNTNGFVFFTNYTSKKGKQIGRTGQGSILFWWKVLFRQVRIDGTIEKIPYEDSNAYFKTRPIESQIGANISPQSKVIESREVLENAFLELAQKVKNGEAELKMPEHWGGYILKPTLFEFWQGRESRLHDRIQYSLQADGSWKIERLAP
jgi:pyridoxamine 5'-phosphate oxidase